MKVKWIAILIFLSLFFGFPAMADMGPKPEINITVKNPPEEIYYLDLMIEGEYHDNLYQNLKNQDPYDEKLLEMLRTNRESGWHLGIVDGTNMPMSGNLQGRTDENIMVHRFGYVGVPDRFRVIVVTKSREVKKSDLYYRSSFVSNLVFDFDSGKIQSKLPIMVSYFFQFITTCIPTLVVEGVLLLIFGFSKKNNWITFFCVNLITQILLTLLLGSVLIRNGLLWAMMLQVPLEFIILVGETIVYAFLLQGHERGRRIGYGITANLCSWVLGFIMITFQFILIINIS